MTGAQDTNMNLSELLAPTRVMVGVEGRSQKHSLDLVAELLAGAESELRQPEVFSALCARERLGSTGLGSGIALPHGRMPGLERPVAAFVRLSDQVDFQSIDGGAVDLILGLLVPEQCGEEHLKLLREVARRFDDTRFTDELRAAPDAAAALELLQEGAMEADA